MSMCVFHRNPFFFKYIHKSSDKSSISNEKVIVRTYVRKYKLVWFLSVDVIVLFTQTWTYYEIFFRYISMHACISYLRLVNWLTIRYTYQQKSDAN